jgi:hypothetical protein
MEQGQKKSRLPVDDVFEIGGLRNNDAKVDEGYMKTKSMINILLMPAAFGAAIGFTLSGCAGKPPESSGPVVGGTGDAVVSSICADAAKQRIATASGAEAINFLCRYKDGVADTTKEYFYDGGAEKYAPYFADNAEEKKIDSIDGDQKLYTFSMYTGVMAAGQKPADVAEVIRLQAFFPTDFKNGSFATDTEVKYSPKNVVAKDFNKLDYDYYKGPVGNERPKIDYSGSLTFFPFGQAGIAVVDKLVTEQGGAMKSLTGVLLIYPKGNDTIVIGRSLQAIRAAQQSWDAVQKNVTTDLDAQVKRDFANYAKSSAAAQIMAAKRK